VTLLEIALLVVVAGLSIGLFVALRAFESTKRTLEIVKGSRDSWESMSGTWERNAEMWRKMAFDMLGDHSERRFAIRDEVKALIAESTPAGIVERCNRIVEILDKPAPVPEKVIQ
jgi:hypothetical protein